jgi:hypothetical protein
LFIHGRHGMLGICKIESWGAERSISGAGQESEHGVEANGMLEDVFHVWDDPDWV